MSCKFHNIRFYNNEPKAIHCMVLEKESKTLAVSRNDAFIELWDLKNTPFMTRMIPGTPFGSIEAMCWVGKRLMSTGLSGSVVEWDLKTLTPKQSIMVTGQAAWCIDVTKSNRKIAIGTEQGYLNLYSVEEGAIQYERIFDKQEGRILCCKFDPSGQVLVTGSVEIIRIWNVLTGQALHRMTTGRMERKKETIMWCLTVTSDLTIITGDSRGTVTFWDGKIGEQIESFKSHKSDVLSLCLSAKEDSLYCAGVDPLIVNYAKVMIKQRGNDKHVKKWVKSIQRNIHTHDVRSLVLLGKKLFSGGVDAYLAMSSYPPKTLVKFPPSLQQPVATVSQHSRYLCLRYTTSLEIWSLGSVVASNRGGRNSLYDADTDLGTEETLTNGHVDNNERESYLEGVDSKSKANVRRLRLSEGANMLVRLSTSSTSPLTCCTMSPNSNWIAYSTEKKIRIFKFIKEDDKEPLLSKLITSECKPCYKMIFSPDSNYLITASADCIIRIYYIHTDGAVTLKYTIKTDTVLSDATLIHLYVSKAVPKQNCYYVVAADGTSNIGAWRVGMKANCAEPELAAKLPTYKSLPTAMCMDCTGTNLIVTYSDQRIVEYNMKQTKFTEFSARLHSKESGLGHKWTSRLFPITCIDTHPTKPHIILLNDDCGVYVINKNFESEVEVESKKARLHNSSDESKIFFTVKKQKHLVSANWVSDDEVAIVIVEPDSILEKLPPAFVKKTFGAM